MTLQVCLQVSSSSESSSKSSSESSSKSSSESSSEPSSESSSEPSSESSSEPSSESVQEEKEFSEDGSIKMEPEKHWYNPISQDEDSEEDTFITNKDLEERRNKISTDDKKQLHEFEIYKEKLNRTMIQNNPR